MGQLNTIGQLNLISHIMLNLHQKLSYVHLKRGMNRRSTCHNKCFSMGKLKKRTSKGHPIVLFREDFKAMYP